MTTNIFNLENFEDFSEKLNMDELYEKKRQQDLDQLNLYNKMLNRIHVKIKTTTKQKGNEQACWFVVPEVIIGVPRYDQGACIAYVMDKLQSNGFSVKYVHPNVVFICWKYWVPSYVREQVKKKTGMVVDEFGKKVDDKNEKNAGGPAEIMGLMTNERVQQQRQDTQSPKTIQQLPPKREYNSTKSYKPTGKFIYDEELLDFTDNLKLN